MVGVMVEVRVGVTVDVAGMGVLVAVAVNVAVGASGIAVFVGSAGVAAGVLHPNSKNKIENASNR